VIVAVVFCFGVAVGLLVGRWWALLAGLGIFLWIGTSAELEVSSWALGLVYAGIASAGIAAGVACRAALRHSARRSSSR
jgi:hypothetical protein